MPLLMNSWRQIALSGTIKAGSEPSPISSAPIVNSHLIPDAMKMPESYFLASYSSGVSLQLPASQSMTLSVPVQPTEEEKKKAAAAALAAKLAAALAAKLAASTSSAQMLGSVLSSLVAEQAASMNGGGPSHPPGFGPSSNASMYPPEKCPKVENSVPTEVINADMRNGSYYINLQQQMVNITHSQPNQVQSQFSQGSNNHFTSSASLMMSYGYNTTNSLQPPPPPPLPPSITMGLARPPTIQHQQQSSQQQQHWPASSGYYRPPVIEFYSQNNTSATPQMPRQ